MYDRAPLSLPSSSGRNCCPCNVFRVSVVCWSPYLPRIHFHAIFICGFITLFHLPFASFNLFFFLALSLSLSFVFKSIVQVPLELTPLVFSGFSFRASVIETLFLAVLFYCLLLFVHDIFAGYCRQGGCRVLLLGFFCWRQSLLLLLHFYPYFLVWVPKEYVLCVLFMCCFCVDG